MPEERDGSSDFSTREAWRAERQRRRDARREERERIREARRAEREGRDPRSGRKERILHTRISDELAEDIRSLAEDLRVPVSNLVRNVLEEAFSAVERVGSDVGELLEDVLDEAERAAGSLQRFRERRRDRWEMDWDADAAETAEGAEAVPAAEPAEPARAAGEAAPGETAAGRPSFPDVLAWQPVVLHAPQRCAVTGRELAAGQEAYMGMTARGVSGRFLSREGFESLRRV